MFKRARLINGDILPPLCIYDPVNNTIYPKINDRLIISHESGKEITL